MNPRPGPEIQPGKEHQLLAMHLLLAFCSNRGELELTLRLLGSRARALWGWDQDEFMGHMQEGLEVMRAANGRLSFWFSPAGLEFDYYTDKTVSDCSLDEAFALRLLAKAIHRLQGAGQTAIAQGLLNEARDFGIAIEIMPEGNN